VRAARERNLELGKVEEFFSPTGKGATGKVDGKTVVLGNANFLQSLGIETESLSEQGERLRSDGATVINIAVDGRLAGLFAIADPVKPSTPDTLKALAAEGIKVIMLTGDNRTTVKRVRWLRNCKRPGGSSPWPATASTTPRRLPPPTSESPWEPAPMSR
jgi:Cu+-exporting ATPase